MCASMRFRLSMIAAIPTMLLSLHAGTTPASAPPGFSSTFAPWLSSPGRDGGEAAAGQYVQMEPDTNRPGQDYRGFDLREARPEQCQAACSKDQACLAFTYVKPGIQGRSARCYLKKGVPNRVSDRCCISGVKVKRTR